MLTRPSMLAMSDPGRYGPGVEAYPGFRFLLLLRLGIFWHFLYGAVRMILCLVSPQQCPSLFLLRDGSRRKADRPTGMAEAGSIISPEARLEISAAHFPHCGRKDLVGRDRFELRRWSLGSQFLGMIAYE